MAARCPTRWVPFSIRYSSRTRFALARAQPSTLSFTTLVAASRQAWRSGRQIPHNVAAFERDVLPGVTHAMCTALCVPGLTRPAVSGSGQSFASMRSWLRPSSKLMQMNTLKVTGLWRHGISGDRPIVLLRDGSRKTEPSSNNYCAPTILAHERLAVDTGDPERKGVVLR